MTTENSVSDEQFIKNEFLSDARVLDAEKGYLSVPSFNLRMKPSVLAAAGRMIAEHFSGDQITAVHGIPHSGVYLATAVAQALNHEVRLHASRKDQNIPTSWKDVYRREVRSFTTSTSGVDVFAGINLSFVKKGDHVLLCDDVCANGDTGVWIVEGLKERGVNVVGFAVLFDKVFQNGLQLVANLGVKVFSCVRVASLDGGDRVTIAKGHTI